MPEQDQLWASSALCPDASVDLVASDVCPRARVSIQFNSLQMGEGQVRGGRVLLESVEEV